MADTTNRELVLEGAELEGARELATWAIHYAADSVMDACGAADLGRHLGLLGERVELGRILGELGSPDEQHGPLEPQHRQVLAGAAELLADMSASLVADEPEEPSHVAFWEGRLDLAWRVLLLVEPLRWSA